jgi:hypothetical protein
MDRLTPRLLKSLSVVAEVAEGETQPVHLLELMGVILAFSVLEIGWT